MESGVYCIENVINGKKYIGQSTNLNKRKNEHFNQLQKGTHYNTHLQNSFNLYGENNFSFYILIYCEIFELTKYEQSFVNLYKNDELYNIRRDCVNSNLGIIPSLETRKKMSVARSGENHPMFGKHHSEESKIKMIENHPDISGKNNPMFGKHPSKETRKKLSSVQSGEKGYWYGKQRSSKTRDKMSIAHSGENNIMSKLKEHDVLKILDLFYNKNISRKEINKKYNLSYSTVRDVIAGKSWEPTYKNFMENNEHLLN